MNKFKKIMEITKKVCIIFLIVTIVAGIATSSYGISVLALNSKENSTDVSNSGNKQDVENQSDDTNTEYKSPTEDYPDLKNEATVKDDVITISEYESQKINSSVISISDYTSYSNSYKEITLSGEDFEELDRVGYGDIFFLHGEKNSPFGGDRFFKLESFHSYNDTTYLRVSEPYFEDVFEGLQICSSDALTEDNLTNTYYAKGVTSHFGNVETEILKTSNTENVEHDTLTVSPDKKYTVMNTDVTVGDHSADLIVEINYNFNENEKEENKDDDPIEKAYGIKGSFGIRDLQAHVICDASSIIDIKDLYCGLSGETFVNVNAYGEVSAKAEMEASKKDTFLFTFEGLNEKRFPIAVFEFKGTTPVYMKNSAFEGRKDSVVPSLFLILYADWEGKISLEINAGFEYSHGFNSGLRILKNGQPNLSFEKYPYPSAYSAESKDSFKWQINVNLNAETDITLFGASLVFYVAGVNIAEISALRIGIQAECDIGLSINSVDKVVVPTKENTDMFMRGYLKILEVKVKLKAQGKAFLSKLSLDVNFEFALLEIELFCLGNMSDKYKPKVPISSMEAPTDFESVIALVCDVSGSMDSYIDSGQTKLAAAKEAAKVILSTTKDWSTKYDGNYGMGIVQFSSSAKTVSIPHIDYKYLGECIDIMNDGGGTSIYSGIDNGVSMLNAVNSTNKVMILMTDGQDSSNNSALESAKKAADQNIKIYTVGFGNDVNEDILKQIAAATGGEYKFAGTDNMMGIVGSFMYAQQATNADVLAEIEDTVGEGETSEETKFTVKDKNGDLMVSTAWPGSFLDTILIDPTGRVVDEDYPGAVTDESKIPSTITVQNPIKGKWSVKVKGIETSYEQEPFYTIISFKDTKTSMVNDELNKSDLFAAYCIPIGIFTTLVSTMLLICVAKKSKVKKEEII